MRIDELLNFLSPHDLSQALLGNELVLEWLFWIVVCLLAALFVWLRPAGFSKAERLWRRIARRRALAVALTILLSLALRVALLPILPIPDPVVHDEYSYLLQAQTFADGRLTNPTPVLWQHFETFHVNMVPSYQSMYPPAQGLVLAAAYAIHVHPWWAVWLSVGLMCGAICWMLQGWMPPEWAFLGGMFCVIRFSTFSYWMNSYWGGPVAAAAGALMLGALPRLKRRPGALYPLIFAFGLAVLANSRPFEGFLFSLPALLGVGLWLVGAGRKIQLRVSSLAPAACLLMLVAGGMAYYNWRGTGNPLFMPYQANEREYHITKPFIWQTRNPIPNYRHQVMRTMYVGHELPDYLNRRYPDLFWKGYKIRFQEYYDFYLWPGLALGLFGCLGMLRNRRTRLVAASLMVMWAGLLIEQWPFNPHYAAPALCAVIALILFGLRRLYTWEPRNLPVGPMLARSFIACFALWTLVPLTVAAMNPYALGVYELQPSTLDRSRLEAQLNSIPGRHLLFVHNCMSAGGLFDWVYNRPDLGKAKIIWARDMGETANRELIRAYPARRVWIVDQDDGLRRLTPYQDRVEETEPSRILNLAANGPQHQ